MSSPETTESTAQGTNQTEHGEGRGSRLYHWLMTPVSMISFLLSLYIVDSINVSRREYLHGRTWMPAWLHNLIYNPQPYRWVGSGPAPPDKDAEKWYYRTKQKKLMRMEAAEAFGISRMVMAGVMATGILLSLGLLRLGVLIWDWYMYWG